MTRHPTTLLTTRALSALLVACVATGCGREAPAPQELATANSQPGMPADHPPVTPPAAPVSRLAPGTVLATVGDVSITAGDLDAAIGAMPSPDRLEYTTPLMIRELVESLVDRKLMAAAARAEGLDRDPVMTVMLAEPVPGVSAEQLLAGVWMEAEFRKAAVPAEEDIARYYREHAAGFMEPARVRVTRVTAASEAAAERLRGELARGATAEELQAGAAAPVLSVEQVWLQDVPRKPDLTAVALGLKPGEVSIVVPAAKGFVVMRADERAPARPRPLDDVRPGIRATLEDAGRQAASAVLRERLRRGVRVSLDEAALAAYLAPAATPS